MVELKWIQMFLFLMLTPPFTVVTRAETLSFTVRDGDEVTLPCENVIDGQKNCVYTTWLFSDSGRSPVVELIKLGQIGERAKSKSDRLSVTANCSLIIKKVTVEDVGLYTCRQFRSGQQQGDDSQVYLSVINMNEQKDDDKVTLKLLCCCWWFYMIGAIGFVALIVIIMIIVIRGKRSKGNKTQMNENAGLGSNPTVAESLSESGRDAADPEDGVSYASISYIKKSNSKAKVKSGDDEDDGDTVTYSTVKAFSSSSSAAGASADPHDLYATVTKQVTVA
ncbi:hypothetical protein L3Q82_011374 [Scortum barcoo]|uniref:Uncharacterized protein n=1 Tax=Scortum barcoo TaxID=214431 RepID=A0ACB8W9Z1_9TELE|nr:hypothetical protein L3Q82_011374 [Scortum barcoo]